ncbi:unnamed protein product [Phytophthora fragariaefolia]|uniref:Unnamed protein product n=1 Tax=Phytophthora fragariaefolia TaxID=1490495 RepID=A0A9W7CWK7_9STRA|nr:unnamed protein product [Phytophthora fragariaefolia]
MTKRGACIGGSRAALDSGSGRAARGSSEDWQAARSSTEDWLPASSSGSYWRSSSPGVAAPRRSPVGTMFVRMNSNSQSHFATYLTSSTCHNLRIHQDVARLQAVMKYRISASTSVQHAEAASNKSSSTRWCNCTSGASHWGTTGVSFFTPPIGGSRLRLIRRGCLALRVQVPPPRSLLGGGDDDPQILQRCFFIVFL